MQYFFSLSSPQWGMEQTNEVYTSSNDDQGRVYQNFTIHLYRSSCPSLLGVLCVCMGVFWGRAWWRLLYSCKLMFMMCTLIAIVLTVYIMQLSYAIVGFYLIFYDGHVDMPIVKALLTQFRVSDTHVIVKVHRPLVLCFQTIFKIVRLLYLVSTNLTKVRPLLTLSHR